MAGVTCDLVDTASTANSGGAAGRTANLRPFQPGQSGNPRGRPKRDYDVAELARQHTAEAIETLAEVMRDRDSPPSARVSAAVAMLDRGYGRAPQSLNVQHETMEEAFDAYIREMQFGRRQLPGA
jgi:hypothetical protein